MEYWSKVLIRSVYCCMAETGHCWKCGGENFEVGEDLPGGRLLDRHGVDFQSQDVFDL